MLAQQNTWALALMLAEQPGLPEVESAEVEEPKRRAVDQVASSVPRERPRVKVPVGDVISRILEDEMFEKRRDEVDPTLVGEHHLAPRQSALHAWSIATTSPETAGIAVSHADEPEVVDAGRQHEKPSTRQLSSGNG